MSKNRDGGLRTTSALQR